MLNFHRATLLLLNFGMLTAARAHHSEPFDEIVSASPANPQHLDCKAFLEATPEIFSFDMPSTLTGAPLHFEAMVFDPQPLAQRILSKPRPIIYFFPSLGRKLKDLPESYAFQQTMQKALSSAEAPLVVGLSLGEFWITGDEFSGRALKSLPSSLINPEQLLLGLKTFEATHVPWRVSPEHRLVEGGSLGAYNAFQLISHFPQEFARVLLYALPNFSDYPLAEEISPEESATEVLPWENKNNAWTPEQMNILFSDVAQNNEARNLLRFLFANSVQWIKFSPYMRLITHEDPVLDRLPLYLTVGKRDPYRYFTANSVMAAVYATRNPNFIWRPLEEADHSGPYPFGEMLEFLVGTR